MFGSQITTTVVSEKSRLSLEDRLSHGNLTVAEVCALKPCSPSKFYGDVKAGLVRTKKFGHRTVVPGPDAKLYIVRCDGD